MELSAHSGTSATSGAPSVAAWARDVFVLVGGKRVAKSCVAIKPEMVVSCLASIAYVYCTTPVANGDSHTES
jgi:hypothetical protein